MIGTVPAGSIEAMGQEIVRLDGIFYVCDGLSVKGSPLEKTMAEAGKEWVWKQRETLAATAMLAPATGLSDVVVQALLALEQIDSIETDDNAEPVRMARQVLLSTVLTCSREAGVDWRQYQRYPEWMDRMVGDLFPASQQA